MLGSIRQSSFKIGEPMIASSFKKDVVIIVIIAIFLLVLKLDFSPITNNIEATIIAFANSMLVSGDYLSPQLSGIYYLDEGPLVIWCYALSLKLFGNSPVIHRLLIGVLSTVGLGVVYYLVSLRFTNRVSWVASILLLTSPLFFILSSVVNSDIILAITMLQFLLSFWVIISEQHNVDKHIYWIMYGSLTSAFLISGILPIFYLLLTIAINFIFNRNLFVKLKKIPSFIGVLLFLICFLWVTLASLKHPGFLYEFLIFQYWRELIFFDLNIILAASLLTCLFIAAGFPWSLLFFSFMVNCFKSKPIISNDQKYLLSVMTAGIIIFCHFNIHELVVSIVVLFPSFILIAQTIDSFRLNKVNVEITNAIYKVTLGAIAISFLLITYILLQVNVGLIDKIIFMLIILGLLSIPLRCRSILSRKGLYHVFGYLSVYNIAVLTVIVRYKYLLLVG